MPNMKILLVHNDHRFGGGSDVVAAATVTLLRERGHEVTTFWRDSKVLEGWRGKLRAFVTGLYAPRALQDFTTTLDRVRPDVVHAQEVYPLITPWIFRLCRRRGIRTVLTCHDYRMTCPICTHLRAGRICKLCLEQGWEWPCIRHHCQGNHGQSIAYALRNYVARKYKLYETVDFFVTPSVFARDWLIQQGGIPARKIQAVGNPVQRPLADPVAYEPTRRTYLGYVGRFAPEKGVDVLLRAATLARLPVRLAGDHRGFKSAENSTLFRFEGSLRGATLERFFAGIRCLVMPSVWFETYGMVAAEAMLRGVPVVCSNLGAMAEMVEDGVTGRLFSPGDAKGLARLLSELWEQPNVLRRMSERARSTAQQFLPEHYVARLESIYQQLLSVS